MEDHRLNALVEEPPPSMYFINEAHPAFPPQPATIMIGTRHGPAPTGVIQAEALGASPQVRFVDAVPMSEYIEPDLHSWRIGASTLSSFGLLALLISAAGLFGATAFEVAARHHEIGIRAALGAGGSSIVRSIYGRATASTAMGVAAGLLAAWAGSSVLRPLLFEVSPTDWQTYATVAATFVAVVLVAAAVPAWRATSVDPAQALRSD